MIVTGEDVAALRMALTKHAVSTKWVVELHRATHVGTDPKLIVAEMTSHLDEEQWDAFRHPERAAEDSFLLYLRDNLHLLIACGFDEIRIDPARLAPWRTALRARADGWAADHEWAARRGSRAKDGYRPRRVVFYRSSHP